MRSLDSATRAALAQDVVPLVTLLYLDFPSTPVALNSSTWDLVWGGVTYKGAYGLGTIRELSAAPGELSGLEFELSGVAAAAVSLALDGSAEWPQTAVTVRTAILDASYAVVAAPLRFTGRGDTLELEESGESSVIRATAESTGVDLLRSTPLHHNDADQQALHPGDRSHEYVVSDADKVVTWPAQQYYHQ